VIEKYTSSSEEEVSVNISREDVNSGENNVILNKKEALEAIGDDEELMKEIYEIFIEEAPSIMKNLKSAIDEGKVEKVLQLI